MRGKVNGIVKSLAIVAGSLVAISSADAGLTGIGKTPAFEPSHEQIFEHTYGGNWHQVGDDFYNGTMSAKRMDDFLSAPAVLDIANGDCGYSTDQMWCGDKFNVKAIAKFSDYSQHLGMVDSSSHTHSVFDVNGYGFNIDDPSKTIDMKGETFNWTRSGSSGLQSSFDSDNGDHRDHLLTYLVNGLPGTSGPVWMLFFEDLNKTAGIAKSRTYADYNDLVVEVRSVVAPVPLPPAGVAGLITLSGVLLNRGRKLISGVVKA